MIGAIPTLSQLGPGSPSGATATNPGSSAVVLAHPAMGRVMNAQALEQRTRDTEERQNAPLITGLAGHITKKFAIARDAKRNDVEPRMMHNLRARRGEYDPEKLAKIKEMGGSEVFAGVTGHKCRAAYSWVKDAVTGVGVDRPWSIRPTPLPELPVEINDFIVEQATGPLQEAMMAGVEPSAAQTTSMLSVMRDQAKAAVREEARRRAERMADKMEDQLIEGGFINALDAFIIDMTTFPTAFLKGPVIRMKPRLEWGPGGEPKVTVKLVKEWERVSPFDMYPSPGATCIDDGDLIQRHRLTRSDLVAMKGVKGYDDGAIDKVLEDYGGNGLSQWLFDISEQAVAEGRSQTVLATNPDGRIDALQFWGHVQGQMLLDWGMKREQVPSPTEEYCVEAWLIGRYVIKAMLNPDPLKRRPYYAASYEQVPGSIWGNSVADLVTDPQDIMNAAARAMVNNAALASGPQVGVLTDRIAPGEDLTQLYPWKIWQFRTDEYSNSTPQPPIQFFQPQSNIGELMGLFEKWSTLADEYSGIPRYMTGDARAGGAGRTASGLSMLMTNAGKMITGVVRNIDMRVIEPVLHRLYYYNMRFEEDQDLKGDVQIVARGAANLISKEAAQVRRNEFLATTANPIDAEIVGVEGRAAILRETAKGLDMDADRIVPDTAVLRQRLAAKAALAAPAPQPGATEGNEQTLTDGRPITDNMGAGM